MNRPLWKRKLVREVNRGRDAREETGLWSGIHHSGVSASGWKPLIPFWVAGERTYCAIMSRAEYIVGIQPINNNKNVNNSVCDKNKASNISHSLLSFRLA